MFLDQLKMSEKQALLIMLVDIAKADNELKDKEKEFLKVYAEENGVKLDFDTIILSVEEACKLLESSKAKVVAIQEVIRLAIVDGEYAEEEKKGALHIAKLLGVSNSKFEEIESWVLRGRDWVAEGLEMINGNL